METMDRREKEISKLKEVSFDVIRRETRNFERQTGDAELGSFVRGVVELETEIYSYIIGDKEGIM